MADEAQAFAVTWLGTSSSTSFAAGSQAEVNQRALDKLPLRNPVRFYGDGSCYYAAVAEARAQNRNVVHAIQ